MNEQNPVGWVEVDSAIEEKERQQVMFYVVFIGVCPFFHAFLFLFYKNCLNKILR